MKMKKCLSWLYKTKLTEFRKIQMSAIFPNKLLLNLEKTISKLSFLNLKSRQYEINVYNISCILPKFVFSYYRNTNYITNCVGIFFLILWFNTHLKFLIIGDYMKCVPYFINFRAWLDRRANRWLGRYIYTGLETNSNLAYN